MDMSWELGPALSDGADDLFLGLNGTCCGEVTTCGMLASPDLAKLARGDASLEVGADLRVGHLAHTATHGVYKDGPLIEYSFSLEAFVAGESQRGAGPAAFVLRVRL